MRSYHQLTEAQQTILRNVAKGPAIYTGQSKKAALRLESLGFVKVSKVKDSPASIKVRITPKGSYILYAND